MTTAKTLWEICTEKYFPLKINLRSENTRKQYRYALTDYGKSIGREPTVDDLDDDLVTIWVSSMLNRGLAADTVRERAGRITALWNWMARRGMVSHFPTVQKPPSPDPQPHAWSDEELQRLFEAAAWEPGEICGIPARKWWVAYLAWLWGTGERFGATMQLRWEWVNLDKGVASIPPAARKGRTKAAVYALPEFTIRMMRKIQEPKRELVFPWEGRIGTYYKRFGRILKRANLPSGRKYKTHSMRVSHATWVKKLGGDPTAALMHSNPQTTSRHYLDKTQLVTAQVPLFCPWEGGATTPEGGDDLFEFNDVFR